MELEISEWVRSADPDNKEFREAVHVILYAVSEDEHLSMKMIMKGGILLGIKYGSKRYTRDIDFSTSTLYSEFNKDNFIESLNSSLETSSMLLGYNLKCLTQSLKIEPNEHGTFPTLKIKIGYANKNNEGAVKRLNNKNSPHIVKIDYSFNEEARRIQEIALSDDEHIKAYDLVELISEKYRSILQQVVRDRFRRQDIYDLWFLITNHCTSCDEEKYDVLDRLIKKSEGRGLENILSSTALSNDEVYKRSKENYPSLADDIEEELPDFDKIYDIVRRYYESMPWELF